MIGGVIEDYYPLTKEIFQSMYEKVDLADSERTWTKCEEQGLIPTRFLVREKTPPVDWCALIVAIPKKVIENNWLTRNEDSMWWQNKKAYITIAGVQDQPFQRIGSSGGDNVKYYALKAKHRQLAP